MAAPNNFGNIGGTLMYSDTPLCKFKFINGFLDKQSIVVLSDNEKLMPIYMSSYTDESGWSAYLNDQIAPRHRYRLLEDLAEYTPIREYIPEQLLRWSYCRNCANHWWVQVDDDLTCWADWQLPEVKKYFNIK